MQQFYKKKSIKSTKRFYEFYKGFYDTLLKMFSLKICMSCPQISERKKNSIKHKFYLKDFYRICKPESLGQSFLGKDF